MRLYTFDRIRKLRPGYIRINLGPRPTGVSYYADGAWRTLSVGAP